MSFVCDETNESNECLPSGWKKVGSDADGYTRYTVIGELGTDEKSGLAIKKLFTVDFHVLVGPEGGPPSPDLPSIRLRKNIDDATTAGALGMVFNRSAFNSGHAQLELTSVHLDDSRTSAMIHSNPDTGEEGTGFRFTFEEGDEEDRFIGTFTARGVQTITGFKGEFGYYKSDVTVESITPGIGGVVSHEKAEDADGSEVVKIMFPDGILNGEIFTIELTYHADVSTTLSLATLEGRESFFFTGPDANDPIPMYHDVPDAAGEKVLEEVLSSVGSAKIASPASTKYNPPRSPNIPDNRESQARLKTVMEEPRVDEDGLRFTLGVDAETNQIGGGVQDIVGPPTVYAYRFYLTYDATKIRLLEESAQPGEAGFSGVPTFRPAEEIIYNDRSIRLLQIPNRATNNMVSVLVEAEDLESDFKAGRLLSVDFEIRDDLKTGIQVPPSITLTSVPVFNENIELAHFYFRARPGTGTVATDLRFVDFPLFDGMAVRNPSGIAMPANFVDGSLTVIDTSDSFPTVRVRDTVLRAGEEGNVQVVLDSQGVENATGFTLHFDNENLELLSIDEGRDISTGAFFFTNPNAQVAPGDHAEDDPMGHANATGEVRLLTALSPGASFAPGERILANLRFKAREDTDAYDTHFRFAKLGDTLEVVDPQALVLVSRFPSGTVRVAGTECGYTLEPSVAELDTPGGEGSFEVQTTSGCPWVATSTVSWITITSGFSGANTGTVGYQVAPFGGTGTRVGTIEVAGESFTVVQGGCMVVLSSEGRGFSEAGGTGTFDVLTTSNCSWTASANVSWITINGNPFGTGEGTVSYTVAENVGQPRTGTITVAGQSFTVTQDICVYTLDTPPVLDIAAEGGTGTIGFSTSSFCDWFVENDAAWISGISPFSGNGGAEITFNVGPNTGSAREATLRIGNLSVRVRQEAVPGCTFSVSPRVAAFTNAGGEGRFVLSATGSDCTWQLVAETSSGEPVSWLRVVSDGVGNPSDGAGSGTSEVRFAVEPNVEEVGATADRQAFIRVQGGGGPAIRVLQAGGPAMEPRFNFTYSNDSQGWEVEDMSALFTPPLTNAMGGEDGTANLDPPGRLSFTVEDNENTFGIWASPAAVFDRGSEEGDLLEASWVLSTDRANPVGVPGTRLRFSTRDFHQTSEFSLNSVAPAPLAPRAGMNRTLRHAFRPVAGTNQLNMFFDVVNFSGLNASDASVALESLTLSRRTFFEQGRTELTRLLGVESHRDGWKTVTAPEMAGPVFSVDSRGLRIAGDPAVDHGSEITFGYWTYEPEAGSGLPVVTLESGRLYQVTFVVSARHARQLEVLPNRLPTFRLRLNESTLATSSMASVVSVGDGYPMPSLDRKVTYEVFLTGRQEIAGARLLPSFDYLFTPDMNNDPDIAIILESMTVRSFPID